MRHAPSLLITLAILLPAGVGAAPPGRLETPAEASGFRSTPDLAETLAFVRRLATLWPGIRVERFGTSPQGRPMTAVVVSADGVSTPAEARKRKLPVVLVQNGIHPGEIDGKDACLMLLRDLAEGRHRDLVRGLVLVIVPVYNVDGHERVSPFSRANQIGPEEGMGFRTTARGLDLNRDFLKAEAPETRALLGLVERWRPALHVDTHVTDGSDHAWVLTTTWTEAPLLDPALDAWLRPRLEAAMEATREAGFPAGPWVDLEDRNDPAKGFSSLVAGPRYATGYFPLRGVPSILVEMHAHKPFERRVLALRAFLQALLAQVAADPADLLRASEAAAHRESRPGSPLVLRWRRDPRPDTIRFPVYDWSFEDSVVTGTPLLVFHRGRVRELPVPWYHRLQPELTIPRPAGYMVDAGWPEIEERLAVHGIAFERLSSPRTLEVESLHVDHPRFAGRPYQGRTRVESVEVSVRRELRTFPAGSLRIPADQPLFGVAVQLLEPEAPGSMLRWGLLSTVFERKEYIDPRTLERLAREMLEDPATAAAWTKALGDEAFASDPGARYLWWYRRTPYWEVQEIGLLPVHRVPGTAVGTHGD